ncbi:MAG: DUF4411 family protein [Bacteroidales bacterium]|nr:DUF4411 family protein [Bacteroidales bacterium]
MRVVIDTNSLNALVRYYLPFDVNNNLYELVKKKIQIGDIIILDAVLSECEFQSNGLVLKKLDFLKNKDFKKQYKIPLKTNDLLPPAPAKFIRQVENQFSIGVMKNKLEDFEFELEKERWLNSADAKLIIYCLNHNHQGTFEEIFLVTEETKAQNDLKVFKKIPSICDMLNINVLTLPELIDKMNGEINIDFRKLD